MSQINASASGTYAFDDQFKVNRLGYGTMQLTGEGTWGPYDDPNNAVSVIKKAVDLGINFLTRPILMVRGLLIVT